MPVDKAKLRKSSILDSRRVLASNTRFPEARRMPKSSPSVLRLFAQDALSLLFPCHAGITNLHTTKVVHYFGFTKPAWNFCTCDPGEPIYYVMRNYQIID